MVDPFFQKAQQNQGTSPQQPQATGQAAQQVNNMFAQQQMQQILQQQQLLQQQYNQLAAMIQNPQVPAAQKQQIQQQAQQIAAQYQQNNQKLQQLGYNPNHVNKPTVVQNKTGSKISMKGFLVGCFILFIVLVGGLVGIFYYLINNPAQLSSVGLDPATTKSLLQVFSVVFFGLVVFGGMGLLVVNGYRLVTVKNTSKVGYGVGLFFGLILFIAGIALGSTVLNKIKNIQVGSSVDTDRLVVPYVYTTDFNGKDDYKPRDQNVQLIAPSLMAFALNTTYFQQATAELGQVSYNQIDLDCGNGQQVTMNMSTAKFDGSCIYFKKGDYAMTLKVSYTNVPTGEKAEKDLPAGSLSFGSEFIISPVGGKVTYNDQHTEMSVGKVPSKVKFDASSVFKDFGLADYKVLWYVSDNSGQVDKQDVSSFTYTYKQAKLYTIRVKFPDLNDNIYTFPVRVEQSDVPVCEISAQSLGGTQYSFDVNFLESTATVTDYQYQIMSNGKAITSMKSKDAKFQYQFPSSGIYSLKLDFITDEGKAGSCESDDVQIGATDYQISYDVKYKASSTPTFQALPSTGATSFSNDAITVGELPTIIQINLNQISPNDPRATKQVLFDGLPVLSANDKTFEIKIDDPSDHTITIVVENKSTQAKTEKTIPVRIKRDNIIGRLVVKPNSIGVDPFTAILDASTTTLNDPTDEIVYFSWDFGDGSGNIKKNLSQSVMQHVYHYDSATENGTFYPKVSIKTKKGLTTDITLSTPIIVKKQNITLKITMDSHPGQVAKVGDRVSFSLEVNGLPKKVFWDFGNEKTLECNARECIQSTTLYEQPGTYVIKAKITYDDKPDVEGSVNLVVK